MSLRVLSLQDSTRRSVALVADSHALIFRYNYTAEGLGQVHSSLSKCTVELLALESVDLRTHKPLLRNKVSGTLGLMNVDADVFLCVVTNSTAVACLRPGEDVQRIVSVEFICLNRPFFDSAVVEESPYVSYDPTEDYYSSTHQIDLDYKDGAPLHPCLSLKQMLGDSTFYFSVNFDLTNRLQSRASEESAFDVDSLDDSYLWNSYMIKPLIQFRKNLGPEDRDALDSSRILTSAIRGFVSTITLPATSSPLKHIDTRLPSALTLISRLSCRRAGTRFNSRGLDDDGNVANFVETELLYYFPNGMCFSYAQIRGSVPVFWEQATGLLPHQQKIQITRSQEATQPAFDRHFEDLELKYGVIHVLNLLSRSKPGEAELTLRYTSHIQQCSLNKGLKGAQAHDHAMLRQTQFDFHAETKGPGGYEAAGLVRNLILDQAKSFSFFQTDGIDRQEVAAASGCTSVMLQQEGIFRTNCLDCLDRTNLVQTIISQMTLQKCLEQNSGSPSPDFWVRHSTLWADNGDALSRIYAGTGALKSSFTRHGKMSFAGAIADARKSATRLYMNNFADKGRQMVTDTLLGRLVGQNPVQLYDPINEYMNSEMERRTNEYSVSMNINIWVGTFNLNGKGQGTKEDLSPWLCPGWNETHQRPDILAVGFQEIVELSPNQILSTDPARRQDWETAVLKTLNSADAAREDDYVLLRSGQLVGAALIILVKSSRLSLIKNVEGSIKKTGMSGMAGNKGAVAIRLDFANTRICFVTAHLAAGFANYDERNADYRTIIHGLRFQQNRTIEDHDTIIWLGDFNYRIGLGNDKVRQYINTGDLGILFKNDQLNLQMVAGHAFPFYNESRITFLPTYKYDNGTDEYDTSEKARIPAWCDRILWKAQNLQQVNYNTAPLRFSDHRPVFATFICTVHRDDEIAKQKLSQEIYAFKRQEIGGSSAREKSRVQDDESPSYKSIAPGLPPASTDHQKWWLNNGMSVTSGIAKSNSGYVPDPERPSNPFADHNGYDWIPRTNVSKASVLRKPAPPIVPKPASVSYRAGEHLNDTLESKNKANLVGAGYPPPPSRASSMGRDTGLPPPRGSGLQSSGVGDIVGHRQETRPPLPSRPNGGLLDNEDQEDSTLKSIPALRPSRPSEY